MKPLEFDEDEAINDIALLKSKLDDANAKLERIYNSPVKKDVVKYNMLVEQCYELNIDPYFRNVKEKEELAKRKEKQKELSGKIQNLESKMRA